MAEFAARIGHLDGIESPWGNAGGVVKTLADAEAMARTGVGWIEYGSITLEPRTGDPDAWNYNEETGEMLNCISMHNYGIEVFERDASDIVDVVHGHGKKLVVNVAPVSEQPTGESVELASRAYEAGADAVLLNAGCRNVFAKSGERHQVLSYDATKLSVTLSALKGVAEKYRPVFLRLSPYDTPGEMISAMQAVYDSRAVSAVFTPNTWLVDVPADEHGKLTVTIQPLINLLKLACIQTQAVA